MHHLLRSAMACFALGASFLACASSHAPGASAVASATIGQETRVIPTRYVADRFIATPVLPRGDTASIFLDTGSSTFLMEPFLPWLEVSLADSVTNARGAKVPTAPFPTFRSDRSLPPLLPSPLLGTRIVVQRVDIHAQNNFLAWIAPSTQGQLGSDWFDGRIWTFDYPGRRLLLHSSTPSGSGREVPLYFNTDSAGRRAGHTAYIDVVVDGDTLTMIFDTGASIWLSAPALDKIRDGGPAERSTTHVWEWQFEKWRARQTDWPVIEKASLYRDITLIRVPGVSVAGYPLGPAWLSVWPGTAQPPSPAPNAPAWVKRFAGTLGGSLLRNFVVTVDYPRGIARFTK